MTGLTDAEIVRLDYFEGSEYEREWVEVEVLGVGGEVKEVKRTETYVYTAGERRLEEKEWDYEEFRREKLRNWAGPESTEYEGMCCFF